MGSNLTVHGSAKQKRGRPTRWSSLFFLHYLAY
jgi:hypothetical protein